LDQAQKDQVVMDLARQCPASWYLPTCGNSDKNHAILPTLPFSMIKEIDPSHNDFLTSSCHEYLAQLDAMKLLADLGFKCIAHEAQCNAFTIDMILMREGQIYCVEANANKSGKAQNQALRAAEALARKFGLPVTPIAFSRKKEKLFFMETVYPFVEQAGEFLRGSFILCHEPKCHEIEGVVPLWRKPSFRKRKQNCTVEKKCFVFPVWIVLLFLLYVIICTYSLFRSDKIDNREVFDYQTGEIKYDPINNTVFVEPRDDEEPESVWTLVKRKVRSIRARTFVPKIVHEIEECNPSLITEKYKGTKRDNKEHRLEPQSGEFETSASLFPVKCNLATLRIEEIEPMYVSSELVSKIEQDGHVQWHELTENQQRNHLMWMVAKHNFVDTGNRRVLKLLTGIEESTTYDTKNFVNWQWHAPVTGGYFIVRRQL
jgi:hypothetical protein